MAWPMVPGLSRVMDHIDNMPNPFARAKFSSACASATVNTSVMTSLTPIIGVTPTWFQPKLWPKPEYNAVIWAWVDSAACMA